MWQVDASEVMLPRRDTHPITNAHTLAGWVGIGKWRSMRARTNAVVCCSFLKVCVHVCVRTLVSFLKVVSKEEAQSHKFPTLAVKLLFRFLDYNKIPQMD